MDRDTVSQLAKLNRIAAMHRKVIAGPGNPEKRNKATLALQAVERNRQALILELLKKDPTVFDAAIDALDKRLR